MEMSLKGEGGGFGFLNFEEEDNSKKAVKMRSPPCYGGSRMLCFGGEDDGLFVNGFPKVVTLSGTGGGGGGGSETTSSTSSSSSNNSLSKANKGMEEEEEERLGRRRTAAGTGNGVQKRPRKEQQNPNGGATKVKKEKLGERIMALQQLVSPFGKSDTASVLHEALGYIKFLHDQVKVLSSPYLQQLPSSSSSSATPHVGGTRIVDLKSRGLCLVPVECTPHAANSNGADLWSPVMGSNTCDGDPNHY